MTSVMLRPVELVVVVDASLPPTGWVVADGRSSRFGGWLELIAQVEALLDRSAPAPEDLGGEPPSA